MDHLWARPPVENVATQRVALGKLGMLEIAPKSARHSDAIHDGNGRQVELGREQDHLRDAEAGRCMEYPTCGRRCGAATPKTHNPQPSERCCSTILSTNSSLSARDLREGKNRITSGFASIAAMGSRSLARHARTIDGSDGESASDGSGSPCRPAMLTSRPAGAARLRGAARRGTAAVRPARRAARLLAQPRARRRRTARASSGRPR